VRLIDPARLQAQGETIVVNELERAAWHDQRAVGTHVVVQQALREVARVAVELQGVEVGGVGQREPAADGAAQILRVAGLDYDLATDGQGDKRRVCVRVTDHEIPPDAP